MIHRIDARRTLPRLGRHDLAARPRFQPEISAGLLVGRGYPRPPLWRMTGPQTSPDRAGRSPGSGNAPSSTPRAACRLAPPIGRPSRRSAIPEGSCARPEPRIGRQEPSVHIADARRYTARPQEDRSSPSPPILAAPPNDARDKDQSAPPRPSARSRLGQPTFVNTHGYGRNAPKADRLSTAPWGEHEPLGFLLAPVKTDAYPLPQRHHLNRRSTTLAKPLV
jgi:hypothetical protein